MMPFFACQSCAAGKGADGTLATPFTLTFDSIPRKLSAGTLQERGAGVVHGAQQQVDQESGGGADFRPRQRGSGPKLHLSPGLGDIDPHQNYAAPGGAKRKG